MLFAGLFKLPEHGHRLLTHAFGCDCAVCVQVNIENPLSPAQVSVMQHFVGYLRARTQETCPDGMVVW